MTETTPAPTAPPHQLAMVFDAVRLHGMTATDRQAAVRALANLLTEAAMPGSGDDER